MINKENELFDEMDLITTDDEDVLCKCLHCGHEQYVPSWLIAEIEEMNEECSLDDHFVTGCFNCNKDEVVTMDYYKKVKKIK